VGNPVTGVKPPTGTGDGTVTPQGILFDDGTNTCPFNTVQNGKCPTSNLSEQHTANQVARQRVMGENPAPFSVGGALSLALSVIAPYGSEGTNFVVQLNLALGDDSNKPSILKALADLVKLAPTLGLTPLVLFRETPQPVRPPGVLTPPSNVPPYTVGIWATLRVLGQAFGQFAPAIGSFLATLTLTGDSQRPQVPYYFPESEKDRKGCAGLTKEQLASYAALGAGLAEWVYSKGKDDLFFGTEVPRPDPVKGGGKNVATGFYLSNGVTTHTAIAISGRGSNPNNPWLDHLLSQDMWWRTFTGKLGSILRVPKIAPDENWSGYDEPQHTRTGPENAYHTEPKLLELYSQYNQPGQPLGQVNTIVIVSYRPLCSESWCGNTISKFERANPGIKVCFISLREN
jgi:hypothetical protein